MYKVIIFDFFGVIRSDQYQAWLGRHGYTRTGDFAEVSHQADIGKLTMEQYYEGLHRLSHLPTPEIKSEFKAYADLDERLIELIKRLKADYRIGLLSNSNGPHLRAILDHNGLTPLFDDIIISGEIGLAKPDAAIFRYTLDQTESKPAETIFIDDNQANITAAAAMGIASLLYRDYPALINDLTKLGVDSQ
jgi:HAD superfamily hydrolase (TIGR01509 family)